MQTTPSCLFIRHQNVALAFDKLNSCLLDVQEWMSSCMLKLNPDKTQFIIFVSHAQLKKLDPYLPVRIFGNFMHPAVVRNLGVWFDANFSFADHARNICKTCFIQMHDLRRSTQYLTNEVAILEADVLASSHLDYCNSLSRSCPAFTYCSVFKMHLLGLLQTVTNTHRHLLFSKDPYSQKTFAAS